jgi:hypothetical protein
LEAQTNDYAAIAINKTRTFNNTSHEAHVVNTRWPFPKNGRIVIPHETMVLHSTLARDISPPPTRKPPGTRSSVNINHLVEKQAGTECKKGETSDGPSLAAIEAGEAQVRDHLAYFSLHLGLTSRDTPSALPRLTIEDFGDLYRRNCHPSGYHFVIHQHDHPISGNACNWKLYSTCHADEGKACITTCVYSSRRRARSAGRYHMACQGTLTPCDLTEWL